MTDRQNTPPRTDATAPALAAARLAYPIPAAEGRARRRVGLGRQAWRQGVAVAERLAVAPAWPHLLFALATVATIRLLGYHFGTFDQSLNISFLKLRADPTLYTSDPFTALSSVHVTFFWTLLIPAYRAGVLEPVVFGAHILVVYLTFWAGWSLSQALFQDRLTSTISVLALILPHVGLAGFSQMEMSLLARGAVLPFILWSLTLFLRRRYLAAFGLLGVLYNFHVLSVNYALGLVVFASLTDLRRVGWRNLLGGLALFVVAALPVLMWRAAGDPIDFSLRPEWLALVSRGGQAFIIYVFAAYPLVLLLTANAAVTVALFFVARRLAPPGAHDAVTLRFMLGILLVALVEWVVSQWLPVTTLIQLQLGRIGVYATVLGIMYFAHYLATAYQAGRLSRADLVALVLALVLLPLSILTMALWGLWSRVRSDRWRPVVVAGLALSITGASVWVAARQSWYNPRVEVTARHDAWYATQIWARDNTPKPAVFMTPPQLQDYFTPGWRVYSERATVTTLNDLVAIVNSPKYADIWLPRFEAVAPGAVARFRGSDLENRTITAQAYYGQSNARVLAAARQYGVDFLVVERPHLRPWPVAFENAGFVIYDLRGVK